MKGENNYPYIDYKRLEIKIDVENYIDELRDKYNDTIVCVKHFCQKYLKKDMGIL